MAQACVESLQIQKVEKDTDLMKQLLSFVEHFSWAEVKEHTLQVISQWEFDEWETPFVAMANGHIVGMGTIMKTDYYPLPEIYPWISTLFVSEDYRGNGICGKMIAFANAYAREIGFDKTYIPTEYVGLYERYGYQYVRDIVNYGNGVDRLYVKEQDDCSTRKEKVRQMIYRLPELGDQELLQAYVQEHFDHGESSISASVGLLASEYPDWVSTIHANASAGNAQWGKSLVYLCLEQDKLIGLLSIRYELPEELSRTIGDIGYGVRPSERNKGYATAMLRHALSICKENGMSKVILGCYKDNPASVAVIVKNGGVLTAENDNYSVGRTSQYYLIHLSANQ